MILKKKQVIFALAFAFCSQEGLFAKPRQPRIGNIYNRSAQMHEADRNPVIVIPGILGSKLVDPSTGKIVWGAFSGNFANPKKPGDARLFALPMRKGIVLKELKDSVKPSGALDKVKINLLLLPFQLNAYANILGSLGVGGYRDQSLGESRAIDYGNSHYTCFQFAYDWRRDLAENARLLDAYIKEKTNYIRKETRNRFGIKRKEIKFDIVAHSMGGLLARYYMRYGGRDLPDDGSAPTITWAGAKHVEKLIMIGTPNAGSLESFMELVKGFKVGPFLPEFPPALLGTMPAIYELLPQVRHHAVTAMTDTGDTPLDIYDPNLWIKMKWGIANPKQDRVLKVLLPKVQSRTARREIALDHLKKCLSRARLIWKSLNVPAAPPKNVSISLYAGDAIPTPSKASVNMKTGAVQIITKSAGDGTVIRSSALMDEREGGEWKSKLISPIRWSRVTFLFTDHLGLTKDPIFTDNMLYELLEEPIHSY